MTKLLLFGHSGLSDTNANGITMKNLLSAFDGEDVAEFYCDVQPPDFTAAHRYFRVTDVEMVKAFLGKKAQHIFTRDPGGQPDAPARVTAHKKAARKIPGWLKKYKYNFLIKWLREYLWMISPWGHRALKAWIRDFSPDVIVYMVGESIFMDKLVLKVCRDTGKPLVLYNGEAFRIIDLKQRHGLERAYYRKTARLYEKLNERASLVIYNCEMLREDYQSRYPSRGRAIVAYNSADCDFPAYEPGSGVNVTYFGNLGVGRSDVLLRVADVLGDIDPALKLDIYGNAAPEYAARFEAHANIRYHGFVDAVSLKKIVAASDILLHVESFDEAIIPKLKYAFSTKIAQCLCAGRCFVSYAPAGTASSRYLQSTRGAAMVSDEAALRQLLTRLVSEPALRLEYAQMAYETGLRNHQMQTTAQWVRNEIGATLHETE